MIAAAFEATYSDWKVIRSRKCVQIVLEVPLELSDKAYTVLGGMPNPAEEIWVGVARLDTKVGRDKEDEKWPAVPAINPEAHSKKTVLDEGTAPAHPPARALSQKVGRFCADIRFRRWALDKGKVGDLSEITVAEWVRQFCEVHSRKDIQPGTEAETRWNLIQSAYEAENRV